MHVLLNYSNFHKHDQGRIDASTPIKFLNNIITISCCHWLINSHPDDLVPLCKYLKFTDYENILISKEMDIMIARHCLFFSILTASFVRCGILLLIIYGFQRDSSLANGTVCIL